MRRTDGNWWFADLGVSGFTCVSPKQAWQGRFWKASWAVWREREPIRESFLENSTQKPALLPLKTRDFVEVGEMD